MELINDLESYRKLVAVKSLEGSTDTLANAGPAHAAIAMQYLFARTNKVVRMVIGSFDGNISDDQFYLKELTNCIERDVIFKILYLDESINKKSLAYKELLKAEKHGKDISILKASPEFVERLSKTGAQKHFSVYDDDKYRFEKDTEKYLAWFSFNDPLNASKLQQVFDPEFNKLSKTHQTGVLA